MPVATPDLLPFVTTLNGAQVPAMQLGLIIGGEDLDPEILDETNAHGLVLMQQEVEGALAFARTNPVDIVLILPERTSLAGLLDVIDQARAVLPTLPDGGPELWVGLPHDRLHLAGMLIDRGADYAGPINWFAMPYQLMSRRRMRQRITATKSALSSDDAPSRRTAPATLC